MNKQEFVTWACKDSNYRGYSKPHSRLALQILPVAYDWYTLNKDVIEDSEVSKRKSKKLCRQYINSNLKVDPVEYGYGSIWISWIFYWILSSVIEWVIRRLLDDWIFKK